MAATSGSPAAATIGPSKTLLPLGAPPISATGIGGEIDVSAYLTARAAALRERLVFASGRADKGDLDGVEIEDGKLYIARQDIDLI